MSNTVWEALLQGASSAITQVFNARELTARVELGWMSSGDGPGGSVAAFRVNRTTGSVQLNRDLVESWIATLPIRQVEMRVAALGLRIGAALLISPPTGRWAMTAVQHLRSQVDQDVDDTYVDAFWKAHAILEAQRFDNYALHAVPTAGEVLAELVLADLEANPTFDVCSRAAIMIGRPYLPIEITQPVFDDFFDQDDGADDLTTTLNEYVSLAPESIDEMVDLAQRMVFLLDPEAMGLTSVDPTSTDIWPLQGEIPADAGLGWDDIAELIATTLSAFEGEAGLDYGDALLIGLDEDPVSGSRLGFWARSETVALDLTRSNLSRSATRVLRAMGWQQFENDPSSFHRAAAVEPHQIAEECVWILHDLLGRGDPEGLTVWGRGAVEEAFDSLDWTLYTADPEPPLPDYPLDHEDQAELVRASLAAVFGEPEEYAPGRFEIRSEGVNVAVITDEQSFPAIRFHHRVMEVDESRRAEVIDFANALHGRASTAGSHWWLGGASLWQVCEFWGRKYDHEILTDQLTAFITVAADRTPEIRARFGEDTLSLGW